MRPGSAQNRASTAPPDGATRTRNEHPGVYLRDMLARRGVSQRQLAKAIGTTHMRVYYVVTQRVAVTADTALRLGRALGTSPEFWLDLQRAYDIEQAMCPAIEAITPV